MFKRSQCSNRLTRGVVVALLGFLPAMVGAADEESPASPHGQNEPHSTLGVFVGDTTESRRDGFTLGLEYEYRASSRWGIGFTAEHAGGDFDTNVFVLPVALHEGPWKFYLGPGIESGDEGEEPLFRVGAEYGLHFGEYEISPQVDLDFVDGERLFVFGIVFAREL